MSGIQRFLVGRAGRRAALVAILCTGFCAGLSGLAIAAESNSTGRIDFDDADLPAANVEVDLSQGTLRDLFGLGDAAIAGAAETLMQTAGADSSAEGTRLAAEQLAAARQIMQLASEVVREARVRV
jgi:hypothetical protein